MAPPLFDWQPGASNAKAAKAAPDAKCECRRNGRFMGYSLRQIAPVELTQPCRNTERACARETSEKSRLPNTEQTLNEVYLEQIEALQDHAKALIEIQYLTGLPERLPL